MLTQIDINTHYAHKNTDIILIQIHAETEETLAATSDDEYEEGNESISPDTSYSAGMHISGDDTDGEYDPSQESPLERVDRIIESLRTASAEEEPILGARLEVVTTFTKPKKVHYSEDSDCGLYSDGSDDTEDEMTHMRV